MMGHILSKYFKSDFARNVVLVSGSSFIAQGLGIILSPIVTRIYLPSEYGVLTVFVAILSILTVIASLDYNKAIPIAKNNRKAINVVALALIIVSLLTTFLFLLSFFFGNEILQLLESTVLNDYIYLIPIGFFLAGTYNIFFEWAYRSRDYKLISKTGIRQSVMSNIVKIGLGLMKMGPIGLVLGRIVSDSAGLMSLSKPIYLEIKLIKLINIKDIKRVAIRFANFPVYAAPSDLIFTASMHLPVVFLTSLFGSSVVGLFGLANSIIGLPVGLISSSFSQVFYAEMANIGKDNPVEIKRLSKKLLKKLAMFGLVPFILLAILAPYVFSFVFGVGWTEAGSYVQILAMMYYFYFIILPFGRVLDVLEKQKDALFLNLVRILIILVVFGAAYYFQLNAFGTLVLFSIGSSLAYILLMLVVFINLNSLIKNKSY